MTHRSGAVAHHRHRRRPGQAGREARRRQLRGERRGSRAVGGPPRPHHGPHDGSPQEEIRGHLSPRAPVRRRPPRVRAPLPRRPDGAPRDQRRRHQTSTRVLRHLRREAARRVVELLRLRRVAREPVLHGRGHRAERQPALSRHPRPRRGRHPLQHVSLEVSRDRHRHPAAGPDPRLLRPQLDRRLSEAALRPDHHGLQPDDAVPPRGRPRRGRRPDARDGDPRHLQRHRSRRGAAQGGDPRDRRHRRTAPEPIARNTIDGLFRLGLYHLPPGAIDFVKYPCTIDGRRFRDATQFHPLFTLEEIFASVRH